MGSLCHPDIMPRDRPPYPITTLPMEIPAISPLIRKWHPQASEDELRLYTEELRAFLRACVELCKSDKVDDEEDSV